MTYHLYTATVPPSHFEPHEIDCPTGNYDPDARVWYCLPYDDIRPETMNTQASYLTSTPLYGPCYLANADRSVCSPAQLRRLGLTVPDVTFWLSPSISIEVDPVSREVTSIDVDWADSLDSVDLSDDDNDLFDRIAPHLAAKIAAHIHVNRGDLR